MKPLIQSTLRGLMLLLPALILARSGFTQCVSTTKNASSTATISLSGGDISFGSRSNALVSDDNYSSASATAFLLSGTTNYLSATNFGFSIPAASSICGIVAEIEESAVGIGVLSWVQDNSIKLVKGGTVTGTNMAKSGDWTGTDTYSSYGGSTNLWGTTLTPADVNASNFGVAISAKFTGILSLLPSVQVDYIRITVYYNPALPTKLITFNTSLRNNKAHLEWTTAEEEDDESISLQRSVNGGDSWTDLITKPMRTGNTDKKYEYDDKLDKAGNYSYRLHISHKNGFTFYSAVKNVKFSGNDVLNAYPNPSTDFVSINYSGTNSPTVSDIFMKPVSVPVVQKPGELQLDIRGLPRGMYFCRLEDKTFRILKN